MWNPAAERMFGWSEEEMIGGPLRHTPEHERDRLALLMQRVRSGEVFAGVEGKRLCKDGSLIDVEVSAAPIRDASGAVVSHVALFADITDRKRQEEELRASRARIVEAGDAERRRLERNLHDGAQQRLVSLSLSLRLAQARLAHGRRSRRRDADRRQRRAGRSPSRSCASSRAGIHPAVLTDRGPRTGARVARRPHARPGRASRAPRGRLPPPVEAAAFYVDRGGARERDQVRGATVATVPDRDENGYAVVEVVDDGIGGADPRQAPASRGLSDRVAALGGSSRCREPARRPRVTRIRAEIPARRGRLAAPRDTGLPHRRATAPMRTCLHDATQERNSRSPPPSASWTIAKATASTSHSCGTPAGTRRGQGSRSRTGERLRDPGRPRVGPRRLRAPIRLRARGGALRAALGRLILPSPPLLRAPVSPALTGSGLDRRRPRS